jgi:atypical dual specificity phosphatase
VLVLQEVGIRRHQQQLIQNTSLQAANPGLLFLVGAGKAGKSSLLAALAAPSPDESLQRVGTVELDGHPLECIRTAWLPQHACLQGEEPADAQLARRGVDVREAIGWIARTGGADAPALLRQPADRLEPGVRRLLAVMAVMHQAADLYLLDEPTADLGDAQVDCVRARLRELGSRACVVVATHNRQDCLTLGGQTALLAGGAIQECADSARFFGNPATPAGRVYVDTGNCSLPMGHSHEHDGDGIWWLVPGLLCGMSRPGLVADAQAQYRRLSDHGVELLVCLEERCAYPLEGVRSHGLQHRHVAIPDMAPPSFSQAVDLCRLAEPLIRANRGVAMHCRGGLGRTGTALAAILIWFGDSPEDAITRVRAAEPRAIQSPAQHRFLNDFADRIRDWH